VDFKGIENSNNVLNGYLNKHLQFEEVRLEVEGSVKDGIIRATNVKEID
jgi:hypothetical protein